MQPYYTLAAFAEAQITEKKSLFIAAAAPAGTEEEALDFLAQRRAMHRTANHNVYAYALREGARTRYSDDGEPAKTAGLPVLETLSHAHVQNAVLVVTRYFGGTLLGTGGLVRAYTAAASAALTQAGIAVITPCVQVNITLSYALFEQAKRLVDAAGAACDAPVFTDTVALRFVLPQGREEPLLAALREICRTEDNYTVSAPFFTAF